MQATKHLRLASVALFALFASACATTQQVAVTDAGYCPFLGSKLCAQLTETAKPGRLSGGAKSEGGTALANLRYIDPNAQWAKYNKVMIAPVTYWAGDDSNISPENQHMLTDFFQQALYTQLSTKFEVVREPGPGVLLIQVALIDASSAVPVLRTISMLIPQARALATLKYLATGTYAFIGSAEAEAKLADSQTHQVLAAAVDKRVGGGSLATAAQWQWGDAENAITAWSKQLTARLTEMKAGKS
jgi:hypothetical protein